MPDQRSATEYSGETLASYTCRRTDLLNLIPLGVQHVLDIGCSDGNLGTAIKSREQSDVQITGVEIDTHLANIARGSIDHIFNENIEKLDFSSLEPFAPFDCIVLGDVLEHLTAPDLLLARVSPLLKADGTIVSSIPNIRHVSALWALLFMGTFPRRPRGIFDSTHLRWFTIGDARRLFANAGFHIEDEIFNLRLWDHGGGFANRLLTRLPHSITRLTPFREFLTYQYSLSAHLQKV